jgi:alkanesulfonate monooxygenase SsuD/methylene tetrahydromethanopterin reductase-like flavin-dependent oxidoreductase (luciferase family)
VDRGGGEQLTLRVVARLADKANFGGKLHEWMHKRDVLHAHCTDVGRDPAEIELTWSPEVFVRETEAEVRDMVAAGKAGSKSSAAPTSCRGAPTTPTTPRCASSPRR